MKKHYESGGNNKELDEIKKMMPKILNIEKKNVLEVIDFAEKIGTQKLRRIPSSKLRKFYDYVNDIEANEDDDKWFIEFAFLKPKIAYNIGKDREIQNELRYLHNLVEEAIKEIEASIETNKEEAVEKFNNFKKFFESIVAYHRTVSKN
jgi:CRISPR type III-A-associated protein Csm2